MVDFFFLFFFMYLSFAYQRRQSCVLILSHLNFSLQTQKSNRQKSATKINIKILKERGKREKRREGGVKGRKTMRKIPDCEKIHRWQT